MNQKDKIGFKININKTNENGLTQTCENITFNSNEDRNEIDDITAEEYNINVDIANFLQEFEKMAQKKAINHNQVMDQSELYAEISNYDMNYTNKQLILICEYYGLNKGMKLNKLKKHDLIENIMIHENNPKHIVDVMKRKQMWYYLDELKADKFFKKYVIW
jgi:hypothetical protein